MRSKAHIGGIRQRPVAPVRRVLGLALSLLMLLASFPMDVTAAVLNRIAAPGVMSETAPDGAVFSNLYDDFGRVVRRSSPQGSVLYEYDEATGRRVRTTTASGDVSYGYDLLGRLSEVAVARLGGQDFAEPRVTEYSYDEIGARSLVRRWNGVETEYGYDALDRLVSLEHRSSNGTSIASFAYSYQADGRRSSAIEDTPTGTSIVRYSYDALGRLLSETRTGGAHPFSAGYAYDLNGNRLSRTVAADGVTEATSYSYDDNDRLLAETTDGATTQYAYDGNGSPVSKVKAGEFAYAFSYNLQGRLAAAQVSRVENGRTVSVSSEYTYNPGGIRTAALQTVDGIVSDRHFLLDDGLTGYSQVLEESSTIGGAPVKSYVLGDDVLAQDSYALLKDGHGSTRALVESDGTVAESYDYDAYGRMLGGNPGVSVGQTFTDVLYSGEQFDPGLQMEYLRARYYDQDSGRFNRIDPFDGYDQTPQSLHKYVYCHCNPVSGIDPSGCLAETYGVYGQIVHLLIQADYVFRHGNAANVISFSKENQEGLIDFLNKLRSVDGYNSIIADARFKDLQGKVFRPDIMNNVSGEVFEIKPSSLEEVGRIQLNSYVLRLNLTYPREDGKQWHPGEIWNGTTFYSLGNVIAKVRFSPKGMILYTLSENINTHQTERIFIPELKKVRDILTENVADISTELIYAFERLDWKYYYAPMCSGLIVTGLVGSAMRLQLGFIF